MSYAEDMKQLETLMRTDPEARLRNVNLPKKTAFPMSEALSLFEVLADGVDHARIWRPNRAYFRNVWDATPSHGGKGREEIIAFHAASRAALDEDRYVSTAGKNGHEDGPDEPWRGMRDGRE